MVSGTVNRGHHFCLSCQPQPQPSTLHLEGTVLSYLEGLGTVVYQYSQLLMGLREENRFRPGVQDQLRQQNKTQSLKINSWETLR